MLCGKKRKEKKIKLERKSKTDTADDMLLYIENLQDATKKLLEFINEFVKVAVYKNNI